MEEGTVVFINNHNLNMSPKLWDEPDNYDPSRFLDPRSGQFSKPEFFQVSSCPIFSSLMTWDLFGPALDYFIYSGPCSTCVWTVNAFLKRNILAN